MLLSDYAKSLSDPERRRYHIKVAKCGSDDPFALSDDQFTNDVGCYPSVDRADINDYLVHGTSFVTREQLKSYKSLEAHNYVTSGLVEPPRVKTLCDGNIVVVSKVFEEALEGWSLAGRRKQEVVLGACQKAEGVSEQCTPVPHSELNTFPAPQRQVWNIGSGDIPCSFPLCNASSPFHLVLSVDREPRSEVSIAEEDVFLELMPLLRVPLRGASHVITLADLLYSGHEMNDRHVSLLVGVQKV
ncbi:hypothetical protein HPB52_006959 [Rhipicephalus sanguineus]|uniref:Uncharacterized protein n=1 Tax=Rhipicephalus sanguineus TaxID=34632 RepID=A0A9D4PIE4_RHISA|nr:hypothetical protein HPB52_006959 [Rhipicephalus sanguineus]